MSTELQTVVTLTPSDIPGAVLCDPFEQHTVVALRWWLLCRGIKAPTSWKKQQVVNRVNQARQEGTCVVDVDGSYLYRKYKTLTEAGESVALPSCPPPPLSGWVSVKDDNYQIVAPSIPSVTAGLVYTYLAGHVRYTGDQGAFRALARGYTHWASGRLEEIEVNTNHPQYCHVRCTMKPSMRPGTYRVYILLGRDGELATVCLATCECAAGQSASCTHVSAVLHTLTGLNPTSFRLQPNLPTVTSEDDIEEVPVTSLPCQWKPPKRRKESTLPMSEATFVKHDYAKPVKRKIKSVEDFDPRPSEFRGSAASRLPELLENLRGEQLCVSLLFDSQCRRANLKRSEQPSSYYMPDIKSLKETVAAFKKSLDITPDRAREIERDTREQRMSSVWFSVRRYRLTASIFGAVLSHKADTPPDNLVLRIIQPKQFSSAATRYGIENEPVAVKQYIAHQNQHGHPDLIVSASGIFINTDYPYLGTSPDGAVYDPYDPQQPFGFLEVKCPYSARDISPSEACATSGFFCELDQGTKQLKLKENHSYFAQIQGQMAIGEQPWCDFVVFTMKGVSVQRVPYDPIYWTNKLLPKLTSFYDSCIAPEIVSPLHPLGLPIRKL